MHDCPHMKVSEAKVGVRLIADGGFTCIHEGAVLTVERNRHGRFVCCEEGKHYLDGQLDDGNCLTGFRLADAHAVSAAPATTA